MLGFIDLVRVRKAGLKRMLNNLKTDKSIARKHCFVFNSRNNIRYYYESESKNRSRKRKYLGTANSERLGLLIKASYKHELIKTVTHDIDLLNRVIADYRPTDCRNIMQKLSPCVREIAPAVAFDRTMRELREWAAEEYEKNSKPFGERVIRAKDGVRVRSKGECIVYNILLDAGLPFRYDPVLPFKTKNADGSYSTVYKSPDFQIKCPDGSFVLIEHAGMLESFDYAVTLAKKTQLYQLNGYLLGYNLFVTSDNADGGIDSKDVQRIADLICERFAGYLG